MQYNCSEKGNALKWPTQAVAMAVACCCVGHRNTICCATHYAAKLRRNMAEKTDKPIQLSMVVLVRFKEKGNKVKKNLSKRAVVKNGLMISMCKIAYGLN